jgi:hypothetical protein
MAAGALLAVAITEPGELIPDAADTAVGTVTAMPVEADEPLAEVEPGADVASGAETHFMAADVPLGVVGAPSTEVDTASVAVADIASTEAVAEADMVGGAGNIVLMPEVSRPAASGAGELPVTCGFAACCTKRLRPFAARPCPEPDLRRREAWPFGDADIEINARFSAEVHSPSAQQTAEPQRKSYRLAILDSTVRE